MIAALLLIFALAVVLLGAWRLIEHGVIEHRRVTRDVEFVQAMPSRASEADHTA